MAGTSVIFALLLLHVLASAGTQPSTAELALMSEDDACHVDADSEECSISLRQLRGRQRSSVVAAHNASATTGFCCYSGESKTDKCGTCFAEESARAEGGSYCDSQEKCGGCGGDWCETVCVMAFENPDDICGSAYPTGIARGMDYCAGSKKKCEGCNGHWCGVSKKPGLMKDLSSARHQSAAAGFCCYGGSQKGDMCGSCYPDARADSDDFCASSEHCSGCGGTWCTAACVMASANPAEPCSTAFENSIADASDYCGGSEKHCTGCNGTWCAREEVENSV